MNHHGEIFMNVAIAPIATKKTSSAATFYERLEKLLPLVRDQAEQAEALGRMTDEVIEALVEGGFFTMMFPKDVGGPELSAIDGMRLVERLSYEHASAGWCTMINNMEGTTMAIYLDQKGIDAVFANGPTITIAGNGVPRGFARPVDGGYMIKGDWAYGSSIHHADWVHSGCFITDDGGNMVIENGSPKIIICHHPKSTIKLMGNWDVLGLRATGSFDYTLAGGEELFVPDYMAYGFDIGAPLRGSAQGYLGLAGYSAMGHTAWAVGVGQRMLDEVAEVIRNRSDPFGNSADSPTFRFQFAQAHARFRAARALVYETWESISTTAGRAEPPTFEEMTMAKLALRHIHDVVSDIATFAHKAARGASLHNTVMQRFYRDVHSGTQHLLLADQIVEECGRALLGLHGEEPSWSVFGVRG
jgi:indole-3-acetate monooxygenase